MKNVMEGDVMGKKTGRIYERIKKSSEKQNVKRENVQRKH